MRILVAEDDFVSRQVLCRYLEPFGTCDVAVDGREAVKAVEYALEHDKPYDLICLDIMMPRMNGHEALKAIRQAEQEHQCAGHAKILIATALGDMESVERAFSSRCDGYLMKPFNRHQVQEQLRVFGLI